LVIVAYLGAEVIDIVISGREKECIEMFIDFVSVVWYHGQMSGCVLAHVLRYITPNCISEDQSTVKWNSGAQKLKCTLPL
jgi:hypothetical protein